MRLEAKKYLHEIQQAATRISEFTSGEQFEDYLGSAMLGAAVECHFEIMGEALAQLARLDQTFVARVTEHRRIVAFRDILIHGYADVRDRLVWDIVQSKLPVIRREVEMVLGEA